MCLFNTVVDFFFILYYLQGGDFSSLSKSRAGLQKEFLIKKDFIKRCILLGKNSILDNP